MPDADPTPQDDPTTPPAPVADPASSDPPVDPPADPAPASDPAPAGDDKDKAALRKESAGYRTRLREEETARAAAEKERDELKAKAEEATDLRKILDGLNQVLNPKAKDEPLDPEKLVAQLAEEQKSKKAIEEKYEEKIRELTIEAKLPAIFTKLQADPDLTLDVLNSRGVLRKLDTSKRSFAADLESAVAEVLEKNPKLKATPAVVRTGTEPTGKAGATDQLTLEQVRAMSPEQMVAAQKAGRLKKLLGG